jgi:hypothetical protein
MRQDDGLELVTATEIAAWVYCPEQWRLQHGLGLPSQNQQALYAGSRHHKGRALWSARGVAPWHSPAERLWWCLSFC